MEKNSAARKQTFLKCGQKYTNMYKLLTRNLPSSIIDQNYTIYNINVEERKCIVENNH